MSISRGQHRAPSVLSRRRRWLVYALLGGVWTTGVAWLVLRYGFERHGEFGPTPHPLQPWALRAHALFAFAALWLGGMLWVVHVAPNWRRRYRPVSGILTVAALCVLVATGYLLYYVADERGRLSVSTLHWLIGLTSIAPFLVHRLRARRHHALEGHLR